MASSERPDPGHAQAPRIDAHHHLWQIARGDYGWLTPDSGFLYRDHGPEHFKPLLDAHGIGHAVIIQAAPSTAETDFLLSLASQHRYLAAVVGWVDFASPQAPDSLARFAQHPKFRGVRPMLQDIEDAAWVLRPELRPVFEVLVERGLRFDALIQPRHLPSLVALSERHPGLRICINHCGKPEVRDWQAGDADFQAWARGMRTLAGNARVACKLSALPTRAAPGWNAQVFAPYAEVLFGAFGDGRLMWASDWPILERNGDYGRWWHVAQELTPAAARDEVFGLAAQRFYDLPLD